MKIVMRREIAEEINTLLMAQYAQLNDSIYRVRDTCTDEEFKSYREEASKVMLEMYLQIMKPIHIQYPDLEPESLRQ